MSITLKDIARKAEVSVTAVSQVLGNNPSSRIGTDTRRKILRIAEELGYRQNFQARTLRTGKSNLIGLIMNSQRIEVNQWKLEAIENRIADKGYQTLIRATDGKQADELRVLSEFACNRVEGIIVLEPVCEESRQMIARLMSEGIPVVSLEPMDGLDVSCITVDRREGAYIAIKHLLDLGHTRIAVIHAFAHEYLISQRLQGYSYAISERGIPRDDDLLVDMPYTVGHECQCGYDAAKVLLERNTGATALFCIDDLIAIGAMKAIREAGLRIPEDIAIVGFDNIEMADFAPVPLTTIAQPISEVADYATRLLLQQMEAPGGESSIHSVKIKPRLIVRESTIGSSRDERGGKA